MNLGERIARLRREQGWSQEELAQQLGVSRQSVSKWESGQSVPDLDKVLRLSEIFGVSTDYLLKEPLPAEVPAAQPVLTEPEPVMLARRVTLEEAERFLAAKDATRGTIALATALCILSPIPLLLLGGASEFWPRKISETAAAGGGMIALLLLCAIAVALFISSGTRTSPYQYLEKELLSVDPQVIQMAARLREEYQPTYSHCCVAGTCLCILSVIPLFAALILFGEEDNFGLVAAVALLLALVAVGVVFFIYSGIRKASYDKLLQDGDYTRENKKRKNLLAPIFWPIVVAVYLAYSFATNDWSRSWIIWPVAALLFAALSAAMNLLRKDQ